ncbi:hypothetical protein GGD46_001662 [Rhizobium lusitanum]|uniref:Uncharacterized protein n=1 Tax=Rhizobium lusitanum TaxID=293958 RepID=A0A7X0INR8_9HYPH|nr:hypothetical protein [Rhizobium lusitanum]
MILLFGIPDNTSDSDRTACFEHSISLRRMEWPQRFPIIIAISKAYNFDRT